MENINFKGRVTAVVPKDGKTPHIEFKVQAPFSQEILWKLSDAMMQSEEGVLFDMDYEPTPLFSQEGQEELNMEAEDG